MHRLIYQLLMRRCTRRRLPTRLGDRPRMLETDSALKGTIYENLRTGRQACSQEHAGRSVHHRPRFVAGVPPDYFSAQGQLWGNPVYNWEVLRQTGYRWCIDRLRALLAHVDVVRLDHFRGFAAAWHVPAGAKTAQSGQWVPGPGADFFSAVQEELGTLPFIAEDLGVITPDISALRDQFQLPGTRILQFAFDGHSDNPYLPATISRILSSTLAPTTITRLAAGLRHCQRTSGGTCGII